MDAGFLTALAALGGSVVGSATSLATTVLSQSGQRKIDRAAKESDKRERLYGQFIDQASKLVGEALSTQSDDPSMLVEIGASLNRMRLFATPEVLLRAEDIIMLIVKLNAGTNRTLKDHNEEIAREIVKPFQLFSEACRYELDKIT